MCSCVGFFLSFFSLLPLASFGWAAGRWSCTLMRRCGCCHCDFTLNKSFLSLEMKTYLICSIQKDESEKQLSWAQLATCVSKLLATFEAYIVLRLLCPCAAAMFLSLFPCFGPNRTYLCHSEKMKKKKNPTNAHTHAFVDPVNGIQLKESS